MRIDGLPKIALGIVEMLVRAVHDHQRRHIGELPKRFELHPAVVTDLMSAITPMMWAECKGDGMKFYGVPVITDFLATRPKLISHRNEVEYL